MSKKFRLSREAAYVWATIVLPLAVAMMAKANLGLSMIAAPTYIVSEKVSFLSYGQAEYIFQAIILLLMSAVVGKFRLIYLSSFATALIYGTVLDGFVYLLSPLDVTRLWLRIVFFIIGMVLTALGVALYIKTYLPPCAYDYFVRTVVQEKHTDLRKTKLTNDGVYLVLSVVLTLTLFHKFVGITWGTLVITLCNGHIIAFFDKQMEKHIEFYNRFPKLAKYF
ncbi:MAG: hypothetical protein IJ872_01370 [Eubacterium sp.]|nr:hypothetical protein [Eubacterium sp.]